MATERIYDELLVLRSQDGDRQALDELVGRWQGRFVRAASRFTGGDRDAAQDAVQEAWMAIVRTLGRLDDPARFGPWAHRIVRNKAIDSVRGRGRRQRMAADLAGMPAAAEPGSAGAAERPERHALVEALRGLPPKQRVLLSLFYQEGFSIGEIAGILEVPAGTVKTRLHRARNQLKQVLEGDRDEPARRQDS
jgi:RNA polymerase sigma-70 factor (ECF subfamily)